MARVLTKRVEEAERSRSGQRLGVVRATHRASRLHRRGRRARHRHGREAGGGRDDGEHGAACDGRRLLGITTREVRETAIGKRRKRSQRNVAIFGDFHTGFPDYPPSVEFSIASHELRELIQSLLQQLRAEYEAAAALCLRGAARSVDRTLTMRLHFVSRVTCKNALEGCTRHPRSTNPRTHAHTHTQAALWLYEWGWTTAYACPLGANVSYDVLCAFKFATFHLRAI